MDQQYKCKICGRGEYKNIVEDIKDWEYGYDGLFSYRQCTGCDSIQIYPFPTLDDLVEAYKIDYHGFAEPAQKGALYSLLYKLVERLSMRDIGKYVNTDSRVLDVGCGIGLFLSKLNSMGLNNIEGIDFSEVAVKSVQSKGIGCCRGTFIDIQKEERYYDVIVMNNYLEHTLNPLEELKKARVLLKDAGVLLGELPNFDSCDRLLFGRYWGGNHVPRHTFQFNADNLTNLLKRAGFSKIEVRYPLNTSHFALSLQNYFQRNRPDLKNNENLKHGRARYYSLLMMTLIPFSLLCMFMKKTGFMKFCARP